MGQGTPERAAWSTCNAKATLSAEAALSGDMPCGEGIPERAAPIYLEQHNLESIAIYAARDGRPRFLCGLPLGRLRSE